MDTEPVDKNIKTSEEEFVNLLVSQRENKEIMALSDRLMGLQKRLQEVKEKASENKINADLNILKEVVANVTRVRELNCSNSLDEKINNTLHKVLNAYSSIMDQKFGQD